MNDVNHQNMETMKRHEKMIKVLHANGWPADYVARVIQEVNGKTIKDYAKNMWGIKKWGYNMVLARQPVKLGVLVDPDIFIPYHVARANMINGRPNPAERLKKVLGTKGRGNEVPWMLGTLEQDIEFDCLLALEAKKLADQGGLSH